MNKQTSGYNLKVVMQETGLNADTLRAWERRYGLPKPERTAGGHRLYTRRDIQMLNWLSERQKEGMSISRAVDNWRNLEAEGQDPLLVDSLQPQMIEKGGAVLDEYCQAWIQACLDFNEQAAERILAQAFGIFPIETVCIDLIGKGISTIGSEWYAGNVSVQQEHFASALAMRRLHSLFVASPAPTRPARILAACPAGEQHEFSLLLLALLLRRRGWDLLYLGADVPILRLETALRATNPFLVISIAQTLPAAASLRKMSEFLTFQDFHLGFGGGIFNTQPEILNYIPGHYLGNAFPEALQTVENLWNQKPAHPTLPAIPSNYQQSLKHFIELQPQIETFVTRGMENDEIRPENLDIAITGLRRHVQAALELGEIRLVESSFEWLIGLLANNGYSSELLRRFFNVYSQALEAHLTDKDQLIFSSLLGYIKDASNQSIINESGNLP